MKTELTALGIRRAKPPTGKKFQDYTDTKSTGFVFRVYATGAKAFIYRYKYQGRQIEYTIGDADEMSLVDAKAVHGGLRKQVKDGINPKQEQRLKIAERDAVPNVEEFAKTYIEKYAKFRIVKGKKKGKKSWPEDQRMLNVDVLPFIGDMKIDKVEKKQINALLDRKEEAGALVARNRLLSLLHKFFNFAIERGEIKSHINPAARITKEDETPRDRVLTDDEIRMLWEATSEESNLDISTRLAVRLRLITGQRSIEIVSAREEDIQGDVWSMDETKNGLAHAIPLTGMALQVIEEARPHARNGLLLPARNGGVMAVQVLSRIFDRIDWKLKEGQVRPTPHDLRRTLRTGLGALNFDNFIQRRVTNHKEKNQIDTTYNRHDYMKEKRAALEAWERKLKEILFDEPAGNVVPFKIA